jgi:hypothetical protein
MENMTHYTDFWLHYLKRRYHLEEPTHSRKSNIKMDFKEMVHTDWIQPAQDSSTAHLITVIYLQVPQKFENFLNSCQATTASQGLLRRVR